MAEPRYKIRAYGAPFELQYSSCSNIKPTHFDWSASEGDTEVWIDLALSYQPDTPTQKQKRYGWLCESSVVHPKVYNLLETKYQYLFDNFYNKIFTCDDRLVALHPNFSSIPSGSNYPWIPKPQWGIYCDKSKLCSMTASPKTWTEGHKYRHAVAKLVKDLNYDLYGGAHGSPRNIKTITDFNSLYSPWNTKLEHLEDYMFHVVIENHYNDSYYTEKLTDCFATGTVPVYYGSNKLPSFFDERGIIRLEKGKEEEILKSLNKDKYNTMMPYIKNNLLGLNQLKLADDHIFEIIQHETTNT